MSKAAYDFSESAHKQANLAVFSSPEPVNTFIFGPEKERPALPSQTSATPTGTATAAATATVPVTTTTTTAAAAAAAAAAAKADKPQSQVSSDTEDTPKVALTQAVKYYQAQTIIIIIFNACIHL